MRFWRTPLDHGKFTTPHGRIHIIIERCKGCAFCVEYCPRGVLQISEKFNKKGYHYPEAIKEDACVDCDLCESICPEFAVYSEHVEEGPGAEGPGAQPSEGIAGPGAQQPETAGPTSDRDNGKEV